MLPLVLTLIVILPSTTAVVSCRAACRNCREYTNHKELIDVYCSMCQECKTRKSNWGVHYIGRNNGVPPLETPLDAPPNFDQQNEYEESPASCPTPPPCDSSGEGQRPVTSSDFGISIRTTARPVLTTSTCPPYPPCVKRKRSTPQQYPPEHYPTQQYRPIYQSTQYAPQPYPGQQYPPQPNTGQRYPPQPSQTGQKYPQQYAPQHDASCKPCMPYCPIPCPWAWGPMMPGGMSNMPHNNPNMQTTAPSLNGMTPTKDFTYVFVGVPKDLMKEPR